MAKVGIRQIAQEAGVSISTVSKAFHPHAGAKISLAAETRSRILAAAKKFNYSPNYGASLLRNQSTKTIGVTLSMPYENLDSLLSDYTMYLINGILRAATQQDYQVLLMYGDDYTQYLDSRRIDGLVFIGFRPSVNPHFEEMTATFRYLNEKKYPYIVVNNLYTQLPMPSIRINQTASIRLIVDHLLARGYRSCGYVGELQDTPSSASTLRLQLLREMLRGTSLQLWENAVCHGVERIPGQPRRGLYCHQDGMTALRYLHEHHCCPEVLVCTNDDVAAGVLCAAAQLGLAVPGQLAVIGYDGYPTSEYTVPPLTTVIQPYEEFGGRAFDFLIRKIVNPDLFEDIQLSPTLLIRQST